MENSNEHINRNIDIPTMLKKLDLMYAREEELKKEYAQLQEDKEILQNMIMYQSNKNYRQEIKK